MSTRCTTHFLAEDGRLVANVYRHADGYPDGHGKDLQRFFDDVQSQTGDTRFSDPSYLAAKLVVWLAREFATSYSVDTNEWTSHADTRPLDFLSVGIVSEDPSDIEFRYEVDCANLVNGRPEVRCYSVWGDSEPALVDISTGLEI